MNNFSMTVDRICIKIGRPVYIVHTRVSISNFEKKFILNQYTKTWFMNIYVVIGNRLLIISRLIEKRRSYTVSTNLLMITRYIADGTHSKVDTEDVQWRHVVNIVYFV